jgi:hypothetical protein
MPSGEVDVDHIGPARRKDRPRLRKPFEHRALAGGFVDLAGNTDPEAGRV